MKSLIFVISLFTVATTACHAATVYKWVDKDGKVQYGDPASAPVTPVETPRKSNAGAPKTKSFDDQTWNRAVDRAEDSPTGSAGRSIGKFGAPPLVQPPAPSYGSRTYTYDSPSPGDAIRQSDAERRYAAQQQAQQQARENHRQQIIANCERQRGSNCRDEATIRYMDNAEKPRGASR